MVVPGEVTAVQIKVGWPCSNEGVGRVRRRDFSVCCISDGRLWWFVEIGIWVSLLKTCVILGEGVVHSRLMLGVFLFVLTSL